MKIEKHLIPVYKTARYFMSGEWNGEIHDLWFLLHGYSHLAHEFLSRFSVLNDPNSLLVAPEGLSRFYVRGYFGSVGASWMTKEDRMTDILNNMNYMDAVAESVLSKIKSVPKRIHVLGFSQGGATAARWASVTTVPLSNLVVYSSEFPQDITDEALAHLNEKLQTWYVYSDRDEFIDEELFSKQFALMEERHLKYQKLFFHGRHEIRDDVLQNLKNSLTGK